MNVMAFAIATFFVYSLLCKIKKILCNYFASRTSIGKIQIKGLFKYLYSMFTVIVMKCISDFEIKKILIQSYWHPL